MPHVTIPHRAFVRNRSPIRRQFRSGGEILVDERETARKCQTTPVAPGWSERLARAEAGTISYGLGLSAGLVVAAAAGLGGGAAGFVAAGVGVGVPVVAPASAGFAALNRLMISGVRSISGDA